MVKFHKINDNPISPEFLEMSKDRSVFIKQKSFTDVLLVSENIQKTFNN